MFNAGMTAEQILEGIRGQMAERVATAQLFNEIHDSLPERQRIRLMGPMDEARELSVAVSALDVALEHLRKPMPPIQDEWRA